MRVLKATVLGLALIGFTGSAALACGWKSTAQTEKPKTSQSTVTSDKTKTE